MLQFLSGVLIIDNTEYTVERKKVHKTWNTGAIHDIIILVPILLAADGPTAYKHVWKIHKRREAVIHS